MAGDFLQIPMRIGKMEHFPLCGEYRGFFDTLQISVSTQIVRQFFKRDRAFRVP